MEHFEHMLSSEQSIDHSAEAFSKQGRWHSRLRNKLDLPRSEPEAELLPPETKIQLEENIPSGLQLLRV